MKQDTHNMGKINRIWRKILVYKFCISSPFVKKPVKNHFRPNDESMERKSATGKSIISSTYYKSNMVAYLFDF